MQKSTRDLLVAMSMIGTFDFMGEYIEDQEVNECIMDMYFYMLYGGIENEEKREEYFKEFEKKYNALNKEQQELVKNDYISIIEAQEKNREKEKIKKKGMRDYE